MCSNSKNVHVFLVNQVVFVFLLNVVGVVALVLRHISQLKPVRVGIHEQDGVKSDLTNLFASKVVVVGDCGAGLPDAADVHGEREGIPSLPDIWVARDFLDRSPETIIVVFFIVFIIFIVLLVAFNLIVFLERGHQVVAFVPLSIRSMVIVMPAIARKRDYFKDCSSEFQDKPGSLQESV